ncbi:unnamed protein product [Darwinula stevensoni]|uniref:Uncharacterized protein n=1 Tax=Darwinula stevensoni TaxID=69355 RepID=A0A7R9AHG9_9CRUS|nr:unnamed protein product [Darwinula stevensoni]CAG0904378.1 unnamed protein product [Darwinula stevensoni]
MERKEADEETLRNQVERALNMDVDRCLAMTACVMTAKRRLDHPSRVTELLGGFFRCLTTCWVIRRA